MNYLFQSLNVAPQSSTAGQHTVHQQQQHHNNQQHGHHEQQQQQQHNRREEKHLHPVLKNIS